MGGWTAFLAAAWSERTLPLPGHRAVLPRIAAVMPDIQALDKLEDTVPQGALIQMRTLHTAWDNQGPGSPLIAAVQAEQYAALRALYAARPGDNYLPDLQQSAVPMLITFSQHDSSHMSSNNTTALPTLRATTPWRHLVTTGGHDTPANAGAAFHRQDTALRWADRFLKQLANEVDREPRHEWAIPPADPAELLRPDSAWRHRLYSEWPPAATTGVLYLRAGAALDAAPPTADEGTVRVRNAPAPGYDVVAFLRDGAVPAVVAANLPTDRAAFTSAPFADGAELAGRVRVRCDVEIATSSYQLAASLWDVDPAGNARWITMGVRATRIARPGVERVAIECDDVVYVLPPGHRLRVALQNVALRELPGLESYWVAPDFRAWEARARLAPLFPARVELPFATPRGAALTPRNAQLSVAAGLDHALALSAGAPRAGTAYAILVGSSGITPAASWFGLPLHLELDAWTGFGIAGLGSTVFPGFAGVLDARGEASARFVHPAGPVLAPLVGIVLDFAAIGLHADGTPFTSAPARLYFAP